MCSAVYFTYDNVDGVGSRTGAPPVGSSESGPTGHVSSPRLVKRSMRISRTTLSCLLRVKGYVAVRVGSAFRAAPRSLSESWSRDYEVSEPRGPPRRPPGSVAHSRVPKQGLREGLRLFGRDRDASNTLQRVSGARSGATARPPGPTDPSYPPARAYSRFRFHAVHTRLHSPSAPRNPRR